MGYQYIENLKNARELILREYDDTNVAVLPDERYQIRLRYYDNAQLNAERDAYKVMVASFETEVEHLWDVLSTRYEDSKFLTRVTDFNDLAALYKRKIKKVKDLEGSPLYEAVEKVWDEISFVKPVDTEVEKMNRTFLFEKDKLRKKLIIMRDKLKKMYDYQYPIERRVMEERLTFLEQEFNKFDYVINPFHLQPGLLLDLDITSIKRKKATLDGMANCLNEFLHGVSKGFQDAAFASFSRRRSTVRADIAQTFSGDANGEEPAAKTPAGAAQYLDMLNEEPAAIAAPVTSAPAPKARPSSVKSAKSAKAGVVDSGRNSRSRAPAAKGRKGLKEL
jgi:hypothetical protein